MKLAILSESPADEAAVRILVEAILGSTVEVTPLRARPGGWNAVFRTVSPTLKHLHYQSAADALVVVVDSDNSTVHQPDHDLPKAGTRGCRLCEVHQLISRVKSRLTPLEGQSPIETAVAVAVPAVEAWYRFGLDPICTEAGWLQQQKTGITAPAAIKKLKRDVYGSDRPSAETMLRAATESATRLVNRLEQFEKSFPNTFGNFADSVRNWSCGAVSAD